MGFGDHMALDGELSDSLTGFIACHMLVDTGDDFSESVEVHKSLLERTGRAAEERAFDRTASSEAGTRACHTLGSGCGRPVLAAVIAVAISLDQS